MIILILISSKVSVIGVLKLCSALLLEWWKTSPDPKSTENLKNGRLSCHWLYFLFQSSDLREYLGVPESTQEKLSWGWTKICCLFSYKSPNAFISTSSLKCSSEKGRNLEATWMWQQTEISLQEMLKWCSFYFGYAGHYLLLRGVNTVSEDVVAALVVIPVIHSGIYNSRWILI